MKNFLTLIFVALFIVPVGILFSGCGSDNEVILVTGVDFDSDEIFLNVDASTPKELPFKVYPNNASDKSVSFTTSNEAIASVDGSGNVIMKASGEAVITVRTRDGGYTDTIKVSSLEDPTSISFYKEGVDSSIQKIGDDYVTYISIGEAKKLPVYFLNENGEEDIAITNRSVTFTSNWNGSGTGVSVINDNSGIIYGEESKSIGESDQEYTIITATLNSSQSEIKPTANIKVYVTESVDKNDFYISTIDGKEIHDGDTIILNSEAKLKAYLLNHAGFSEDFEIFFSQNDNELFDCTLDGKNDENSGIYTKYFTLNKRSKEGNGTLTISLSRAGYDGNRIEFTINVVVEAEVSCIKAQNSNAQNTVTGVDVIYDIYKVGDSFSLEILYYDSQGHEISVTRDIYFEIKSEDAEYIKAYNKKSDSTNRYLDNFFQINSATSELITIKVVDKEDSNIYYEYKFYIAKNIDRLVITSDHAHENAVNELYINENGSAILYFTTESLLSGGNGGYVQISCDSKIVNVTPNYADGTLTIIPEENVVGVEAVTFTIVGSHTAEYTMVIYVI